MTGWSRPPRFDLSTRQLSRLPPTDWALQACIAFTIRLYESMKAAASTLPWASH